MRSGAHLCHPLPGDDDLPPVDKVDHVRDGGAAEAGQAKVLQAEHHGDQHVGAEEVILVGKR